MIFSLIASILIDYAPFDIEIAPRLLLNQQLKVCSHQVDTSLYAQFFADKRRLKNGFRFVERRFFAMKKLVYNLLNIATLLLCAMLKVVAHVHIATRAIFKSLLTKALFQAFLPTIMFFFIDNII